MEELIRDFFARKKITDDPLKRRRGRGDGERVVGDAVCGGLCTMHLAAAIFNAIRAAKTGGCSP